MRKRIISAPGIEGLLWKIYLNDLNRKDLQSA
jgi:hypothetical protein